MLMQPESVRAIIAGRKTQTRRTVDMRGIGMIGGRGQQDEPGAWGFWDDDLGIWWTLERGEHDLQHDGHCSIPCPYGEPGTRIWVREPWATLTGNGHRTVYRADADPPLGLDGSPVSPMRWTPSIYMPRWASRLVLEITDIRIERLQAITEGDATAEGACVHANGCCARCNGQGSNITWPMPPGCPDCLGTGHAHVIRYRELWDRINGRRAPWKMNAWVWVVAFKVAELKGRDIR
jgi:hypothetical protein